MGMARLKNPAVWETTGKKGTLEHTSVKLINLSAHCPRVRHLFGRLKKPIWLALNVLNISADVARSLILELSMQLARSASVELSLWDGSLTSYGTLRPSGSLLFVGTL